ncbi:MAG: hypothetical protein Q9161_002655 [Pseudevernia consocians]
MATDEQAPASKKSKTADSTSPQHTKPKPSAVDMSKLDALLPSYGNEPTPEAVLALLYLVMLSSARVSHELASMSLQCLIEAGYHDIETLEKSTWQERTGVLTKGGYTRYREKTATALGEWADLIEKRYGVLYLDEGSPSRSLQLTSSTITDNDLRNLLTKADSSSTNARKVLREIKGIGKVGTDTFFDVAQGIWPSLAPFIDPRSMETAKHCGLGSDVDTIWDAVRKDADEMCKLSLALTLVRLENQEKKFQRFPWFLRHWI